MYVLSYIQLFTSCRGAGKKLFPLLGLGYCFRGVTVNAPVMNVLINRVVLTICTTIPDCDTCDKLHTLPDFDLGNTDCVVLVTPVCGHAIPDL